MDHSIPEQESPPNSANRVVSSTTCRTLVRQPVLKSLRKAGVNRVAIHGHMTHEYPRILFLHYWGRGKAEELANAVKSALDTQSK